MAAINSVFTTTAYSNAIASDKLAWMTSVAYKLLPSILLSAFYIISFALIASAFYVRKYALTARRREKGNAALFCLYFFTQLIAPIVLGLSALYAYKTDFSDSILPQFQLPLVVAVMGFSFAFFETSIPKALDYEVEEGQLSLRKCAIIKQGTSLVTIFLFLTLIKTSLYLTAPALCKAVIIVCSAALTVGNSIINWKMLHDGTITIPDLPALASLIGLPTYAMAMDSKPTEEEEQPPAYTSLLEPDSETQP